MANSKISALTSATTPLAGTETLPVVQSGSTKQVSVANLTAGRAVSMASASVTGTAATGNVTATSPSSFGFVYSAGVNTNVILNNALGSGNGYATNLSGQFDVCFGSTYQYAGQYASDTGVTASSAVVVGAGTVDVYANTGLTPGSLYARTKRIGMDSSGNVTLNTGNLVQGTAAKGINFTANTPAAGMTSQLLNWYEEGTWTPNQGSGLTVVGAFNSSGKYTRIGRQITVSGTVSGGTTVAIASAGVISTNLPFTVGTTGHGGVVNATVTASAVIVCTGTSLTSSGAIASTTSVTFTAVYII